MWRRSRKPVTAGFGCTDSTCDHRYGSLGKARATSTMSGRVTSIDKNTTPCRRWLSIE
jgi:hypothetical protein